jgi:hypothetical protein
METALRSDVRLNRFECGDCCNTLPENRPSATLVSRFSGAEVNHGKHERTSARKLGQ